VALPLIFRGGGAGRPPLLSSVLCAAQPGAWALLTRTCGAAHANPHSHAMPFARVRTQNRFYATPPPNLNQFTRRYAMTLDGKIATDKGHSAWVTSPAARAHVFRTRANSDVVIVGGNTVS